MSKMKLTLTACALALAVSSKAAPVLGQSVVVATDGDVIAKFLGSDAGFDNLLFLSSPGPTGTIFEGHVTPVGSTVNLGFFSAGTELIFGLNNQQGDIWYTGPGSRNADGLEHAIVDDAYAPGETYVGFEDLPGGGDLDFNDIEFSFTNVRGTDKVPDGGSTFALLGLGAVALGAARRKLA